MILRADRFLVIQAFAEALDKLYPSYRHEWRRERGARTYTIRVYCRATGALLQTRAEV
jgi:hypothetical protein